MAALKLTNCGKKTNSELSHSWAQGITKEDANTVTIFKKSSTGKKLVIKILMAVIQSGLMAKMDFEYRKNSKPITNFRFFPSMG